MKKPKIGIAISLYNKFEELGILVDIIRHNWKNDYIISVCSNFPDAEPYLKKLDLDHYVIGDDIKFNPKMEKLRSKINKQCRIFDCVKKSCSGAIDLGCDYVMHLHTDAWPLNEESVKNLISNLQKKDKKLAIRGMGFTRYRQDCPLGHVDDMFFIFDTRHFKKIDFFNVNPLAMLPGRLSIHGILSTLIVGKLHLDKVYFYDNLTTHKFWDGKHHNIEFRGVIPTIYDEKRGFLHIHRGGLPGKFCENLQAMYLNDFDLTKGKNIQEFLSKYLVNKQKLLFNIKKVEQKIDRKLQWRGFPKVKWSRFGRDASRKIRYLNYPISKKIRYWALAMGRNIWDAKFKKKLGVELTPDFSIWPESLDSFYTRKLIPEDYVKGMVWYEQKIDKEQNDKPIYSGYKGVYW